MKPERSVSLSFGVSSVASLGLVVTYALGGRRVWEAILLGLALGGLGLGIVLWATRLMDSPIEVEDREPPPLGPEDGPPGIEGFEEAGFTRRRMLVRLLAGAGGTLAAALAIPTLSLGPTPGATLFRTRWTRGARVVDSAGNLVRPASVPVEGVITVYPEGHEGAPDSQTLLLRVDERLLDLPEERERWAPEGCVGYSKICTHAGCPVGLYRARAHELLCPCHQSTFDVLRGAVPVFGPAARPLPQLPLAVDGDGYLVALGDFSEPAGPSFWNYTRGDGGS